MQAETYLATEVAPPYAADSPPRQDAGTNDLLRHPVAKVRTPTRVTFPTHPHGPSSLPKALPVFLPGKPWPTLINQ